MRPQPTILDWPARSRIGTIMEEECWGGAGPWEWIWNAGIKVVKAGSFRIGLKHGV